MTQHGPRDVERLTSFPNVVHAKQPRTEQEREELRRELKRLQEEELTIRLTDEAVGFLVEKGYDEKFGARPLKRAIQRYLEDPLSGKILMAEFSAGDEIEVGASPDGEGLTLQAGSTTKT